MDCFLLDNQESLHPQSREPQQAGEEEMEPEQGEDVPPSDELSQVIDNDTFLLMNTNLHNLKQSTVLTRNYVPFDCKPSFTFCKNLLQSSNLSPLAVYTATT